MNKRITGALLALGMLLTSCTPGGTPIEVSQEPQIFGNPDAPVTLIEFADFQCPACAAAEPFVKRILIANSDKIRFEFRHFPLRSIHPNAEKASMASEAAGKQGKFWEMHDKLYAEQPTWSNAGKAEDLFVEYAKELGLNEEQFVADMKDPVLKAIIERDIAYGESLKVNSTPSFYLNGNKLRPSSFQDLERMVNEAIAEAR